MSPSGCPDRACEASAEYLTAKVNGWNGIIDENEAGKEEEALWRRPVAAHNYSVIEGGAGSKKPCGEDV